MSKDLSNILKDNMITFDELKTYKQLIKNNELNWDEKTRIALYNPETGVMMNPRELEKEKVKNVPVSKVIRVSRDSIDEK